MLVELYEHPQGIYAPSCEDATQNDIDGFKAGHKTAGIYLPSSDRRHYLGGVEGGR